MSTNEYTSPFKITPATKKKVGFLLSIPHGGVLFPEDLKSSYDQKAISCPDDTDWDLNRLYEFAPDLGITTIEAVYSRWLIDLNRAPDNVSLYDDGRIITALCPTTDFLGNSIYRTEDNIPSEKEIERRIALYYRPYHQKIDELLAELKEEFETVVFWDAHSIRRSVKTIQSDNFPDLILGDNEGRTATSELIDLTLESLKQSSFEVQHNHPFKGGYLTRSKGKPDKGIHALQLEMSKDLYMTNDELDYDAEKAKSVQHVLADTFTNLITHING